MPLPENLILYNKLNSFFTDNEIYTKFLIQNYIKGDVDNFLDKNIIENLIQELYNMALSKTDTLLQPHQKLILKKYIENTFNLFLKNRHKGSGLIVSLQTQLLNMAIDMKKLTKKRILFKGIRIFTSVVKRHSYGWFYYGYNTNKKFYLKNNLIIPFSQYINNKKNIRSFYYEDNFSINEILSILNIKDNAVKLNSQQLNEDLKYAKQYVEKQFFFKKGNKTLMQEIITTPIGTFFVIKDAYVNEKLKMKLFYSGKTEDFIKIQNLLINKS